MIRRLGFCYAAGVCLIGLLAGATGGVRAQVVINELLAVNRGTNIDEDGEYSDWVELYNPSATDADLTGWGLSDDEGTPRKWEFPEFTLPAGEFLLAWCSGKDRTTLPTELIEDPEVEVPFQPSLISVDDEWRYLVGMPDAEGPPGDWNQPGFDDAQWESGKPRFGFGDPDLVTELPEDIGAVFFRRAFSVERLPKNLVLEITFDDGFVAFLNGVEVAAVNRPAEEELTFASLASRSHEARNPERLDLTAFLDTLQVGENLLAIALFNRRANSNDLSLIPQLGTVPPVFHTNFRLNRDGETVVLANPRGVIQDRVTYPPQSPDQSYGRSPDGTGPFLYHLEPTPRAPNSGPTSSEPLVAEEVAFDPEHGFYEAPFDATITVPTEGAEIRYTTDGSTPTATTGTVYMGPIRIADTTVLRVAAFKPDHRPSPVRSCTYIFLETPEGGGVLNQPRDPPGFPSRWGGAGVADYAMDSRIATDTNSPYYDERVKDALLALPTMSIVTDLDNLFDPSTGIYSNPQREAVPQADGTVAFEVPVSVELFYPDERTGFRINAGLRIQGDASRNPNRPKHNMRLLFKKIYGAGKLNFPFFDDSHITSFDTIILRGGNGDSWFHPNATQQQRAQYIRDQWHRDTQIEMGHLSPHQNYTHLYMNGLYWGVFHNFEKPNASFLATYIGGDESEYDAQNLNTPIDGNPDAWNEMVRLSRSARSDPGAYAEIQEYLDVTNLIDFLLINFFSGNIDWDHNNWFAGRRRVPGAGYVFFCWDAERSFWNPGENRVTLNNTNGPTGIHQALKANEEYRVLFGDRVHKHFFNRGTLTAESADERWMKFAREVELPLVAESARWGDNKRSSRPYAPGAEWETELRNIRTNYLAKRTELVLGQLRQNGVYPNVTAPVFGQHGGRVPDGFRLVIHAPEGTIYYTTDGSDPRLPGGLVSPEAFVAETPERVSLVASGADARVTVPVDDSLGLDWTALDFNDSGWTAGQTAVGFEKGTGYQDLIAIDVGEEMYEKTASVYLRIPFSVDDAESLSFLTLRMKYDDGFIAYLNGVRVLSINAPEDPQWDSTATGTHGDTQAKEFEDFELSLDESPLRTGRNVLGIHGMNRRARDGDLLFEPELHAFKSQGGILLEEKTVVKARALVDDKWSALNEATFLVGDVPLLAVTEIMYNPAPPPDGSPFGAQDFEFIELQNIGEEPEDLTELRFTGAVEFDFSVGDTLSVAPGGFVLVVKNREAFESRYDTSFMTIAGEFRRNLSNAGEEIILTGAQDETVLAFEYSDWIPSTDGEGHSLVLFDIASPPETWSERSSWRASRLPGGSPGEDDAGGGPPPPPPPSLQLPADVNQDGTLNVTDAVNLLDRLFGAPGTPLPCEGDDIAQGGNLVLHDFNGDRSVNLTDAVALLGYLFSQGAPPALGRECVAAEGCPDICVP